MEGRVDMFIVTRIVVLRHNYDAEYYSDGAEGLAKALNKDINSKCFFEWEKAYRYLEKRVRKDLGFGIYKNDDKARYDICRIEEDKDCEVLYASDVFNRDTGKNVRNYYYYTLNRVELSHKVALI